MILSPESTDNLMLSYRIRPLYLFEKTVIHVESIHASTDLRASGRYVWDIRPVVYSDGTVHSTLHTDWKPVHLPIITRPCSPIHDVVSPAFLHHIR